jgi:protocatechuate 3,4-dioxygenase beta subunit
MSATGTVSPRARRVPRTTVGAAAAAGASGGTEAPAPIAGVVVDAATGLPLAGARVAIADAGRRLAPARAREAETDAGGRFALPRPGRRTALVLARSDDHLPEIVPVRAGQGDLVVALARAGTVEGTLVGRDGAPLAGAHVRALSRDALDVGHATTDAAGRFTIATLRPGCYLVEACELDDEEIAPACVQVRTGATARLALVAGTAFLGRAALA